jgi:HSP20 family molecular chaperone IbpA
MESDDWEWPEEKPIASQYYNSAVGGIAPPPKKLSAEALKEEETPASRITQVRNYSWSDDTNFIRIYVPVPGVVRNGVEVLIEEDRVDLSASTPEYGKFTMAIRRLYDKVNVAESSYKVLEKKEKVIIALAKYPPPGYGSDSYINFKPWYRLHHGTTDNIDVCDDFESARLSKAAQMNAAQPQPPKLPTTTRRKE